MHGDDQYVLEVFEKSGAGVSYVLARDEAAPSFMVTYGWSVNFGLPEFIICGDKLMLPEWKRIYGELIIAADAAPCIEDFQRWPIRFKNHPLVSMKVDPTNVTDDWFEDALSYRRRAGLSAEMPAHQLFWADRDGNPPWVEGRFSPHPPMASAIAVRTRHQAGRRAAEEGRPAAPGRRAAAVQSTHLALGAPAFVP